MHDSVRGGNYSNWRQRNGKGRVSAGKARAKARVKETRFGDAVTFAIAIAYAGLASLATRI